MHAKTCPFLHRLPRAQRGSFVDSKLVAELACSKRTVILDRIYHINYLEPSVSEETSRTSYKAPCVGVKIPRPRLLSY
jgi:hypothetical protein